ncbi:MAG: WYL domain-containing protein [Demequina sp.]
MVEKALPRLTRLLGIVTYLEQHGDASFDELAEHFNVTSTQIHRDVNTLWVSGLPGYMTDDLLDFDATAFDEGIASLTNSQGVTQVRLSAREAVALIGALSTLVAAGAAPAAATSALAKLRDAVGGSEPVTVVPASHVDPEVTTAILEAVSLARVARVVYVDAQDRRSEREIEPHRVVTIDGIAYVECFCRRAMDYRTLRVDRMLSVLVTDADVMTPASDEGGFVLVPRFTARVVVARASRWALEDLPGVELAEVGDNVEATFGVADADWVASRLLTIAPGLRSVEPASLRDTLAAHARTVIAAQAG